ncbi:MAG: hypothetical protein GY715_13950 [Planctomycetes bacterium]|nr:hypothetical protein [Planctomycetota bacterium]
MKIKTKPCLLAAMILTAMTFTASAQDEPARRDLDAARERVHALMQRAEEAERRGHHEAAAVARREAEALHDRIATHLRRLDHGQKDRDHVHGAMVHLEHAIESLRETEHHDMREHLEGVLERMRAMVRVREHAREPDQAHRREGGHERPRRPSPRHDRTRRALEIMRTALPALLEADRRDAAELLELAIRARELAMEGRDAPETRIGAPTRAQLIELLQFAADLWGEFGHEGKAQAISEFAAEMREAWREQRRDREARAEPRPPRERRARRDTGNEEPQQLRQLRRRLDKLRESLDRLERELDELQGSRRD